MTPQRLAIAAGLAVAFGGFAFGIVISAAVARSVDAAVLAGIGTILVISGRVTFGGFGSRRRAWMRRIDDPDRPVPVLLTDPSRVPSRRVVLAGIAASGFGVGLFAAQSLPGAILLLGGAAALGAGDAFRRT